MKRRYVGNDRRRFRAGADRIRSINLGRMISRGGIQL